MRGFYRHMLLASASLAAMAPALSAPSFADDAAPTSMPTSAPEAATVPLSWASAEALVWWVKPSHLPPTLTTFAPGSPSATTGSGGELGLAGTTALSPDHMDNNPLPGGRFSLGHWLYGTPVWGVEAQGFFLANGDSSFAMSSSGTPPLRVPFTNVPPGAGFPLGPSSFVLADPGFAAGSQVINASFNFWGIEGDGVYHEGVRGPVDISFLGGFRFVDLDEGLSITSKETLLGAPGGSYTGNDNFATKNHFYGGELGVKVTAATDTDYGTFDGLLVAKLALGDNNETVGIAGGSSSTGFGGPPTSSLGGIFTQSTNIGQRSRNAFAVIPELQIQLGYRLPNGIHPFIAYNFIYLSDVVRPGDQIDTTLNFTGNATISPGSTLTGAARPQPMFHSSGFWAQGVNIGVSYAF